MWILLDDERTLPKSKIDVICREVDSFLDILTCTCGEEVFLNPIIEGVILDHDLGTEAPPAIEILRNRSGKKKEVTGYDVLMYMNMRGLMPPVIMLCTGNPVGRKNMHSCLIHDCKYVKRGNRYIRPDVITWKPEYKTDKPDAIS